METKTAVVARAMAAGNHKEALRIASGFKLGLTKQDQAILKRGYECMVWPAQYVQLGKDPAACIKAALSLVQSKVVPQQEH